MGVHDKEVVGGVFDDELLDQAVIPDIGHGLARLQIHGEPTEKGLVKADGCERIERQEAHKAVELCVDAAANPQNGEGRVG